MKWHFCIICLNTSYLTDSYIIFTLKMESVSKNFQRSEINWSLTMNLNAWVESFNLQTLDQPEFAQENNFDQA